MPHIRNVGGVRPQPFYYTHQPIQTQWPLQALKIILKGTVSFGLHISMILGLVLVRVQCVTKGFKGALT